DRLPFKNSVTGKGNGRSLARRHGSGICHAIKTGPSRSADGRLSTAYWRGISAGDSRRIVRENRGRPCRRHRRASEAATARRSAPEGYRVAVATGDCAWRATPIEEHPARSRFAHRDGVEWARPPTPYDAGANPSARSHARQQRLAVEVGRFGFVARAIFE